MNSRLMELTTYSQTGQDLKVIDFYKKKQYGYFLEIGAFDGITCSNTYLLERDYFWKGICVEPVPYNFEKLKINRPKAICSDYAVYSETGLTLKFEVANALDMLSGISTLINDCHRAMVFSDTTTIEVKTISLTDLLDINNAPTFIDYMSLDTEGSEYDILKTFNFEKYIVGIIHLEHNFTEPMRSQIRELLLSKDYVFVEQNLMDDIYHHASIM